MAHVFDVAKYVLNQVGEVTTMKLEKLVYYCQAWALAWDDKPLFPQDFEAWANGPVCPELFAKHKGIFEINSSMFAENETFTFSKEEIATMDAVIQYYGGREPHWLSELTHKEDPWKNARGNCPAGASCNHVIAKESMQQYYGGL